jgi:putative drug exporter of the RND superfamily
MASARRLTGTAGRWSATHRWLAIGIWVASVIALLVTGHLAGTRQLDNSAYNVRQSAQAERMVSQNFVRHASETIEIAAGTSGRSVLISGRSCCRPR